jgi:hypothetical protein
MHKNTNMTRRRPITLTKETVIKLTDDLLEQVAGGRPRITAQSACPTACTIC